MKLRRNNKLFVFLVLMVSPLMVIGQECNESMVVDTPNERFEDLNNGTVLDRNTQLVWKKCAEGQTYNSNTGGCDGEARRGRRPVASGRTAKARTPPSIMRRRPR